MSQPPNPPKKKSILSKLESFWNGRIAKLFRWWIVASLVLTLLSIVGGMYLDSLGKYGFWVNVLAGIPSIFITFLVGIFILDKYEEDKWSTVRKIYLTNLRFELWELENDINEMLMGSFPNEWDALKIKQGTDTPKNFINYLLVSVGKNTLIKIDNHYIDAILERLEVIKNQYLNQLIQSACNQEIIDVLVYLYSSGNTLREDKDSIFSEIIITSFPLHSIKSDLDLIKVLNALIAREVNFLSLLKNGSICSSIDKLG